MNGHSANQKRTWVWLALGVLIYVAPYFLCSEIYHGQWNGAPIKLRLFHYKFETLVWIPLLKFEQLVTPGEFEGHICSGASLPPPDPAYSQRN